MFRSNPMPAGRIGMERHATEQVFASARAGSICVRIGAIVPPAAAPDQTGQVARTTGTFSMAVETRYQRPDPQRQLWVTAPLFVHINGEPARIDQWCLDGLRIAAFEGTLPPPGEPLQLRLTLPFQGFEVGFDANGEVVDPGGSDRNMLIGFVDLGARERELMAHFFEELLRGSMVAVRDTIQRIDVPVLPVSLASSAVMDGGRRPAGPLKSLAMTGFYGVLGAAVFGYLALLIYSNLFRLEVPSAVVSSPTEVALAQGEGHVLWVGVKPGDTVKAGDVVVELHDNLLEREIENAEIGIREREAKLAFLQQQFEREKERLERLGLIENRTAQQVTSRVESLKAQLKMAELEVKRASAPNIAARLPMALLQAKRNLLNLQQQIDSKELELKSRTTMTQENAGRRVYTGHNLVGDLGQIESQVALAEQEVEFAKQRYKSFLNQRDGLAVRAPFDGVVTDLPRVDKGGVKRGDVIAVIEQPSAHLVTAYLSQDEVLKVGLGDHAVLYVPAIGITVKAEVRAIDRTAAFMREQGHQSASSVAWRAPAERSAKVTLAMSNVADAAATGHLRSGLPVVVIFEKHTTNGIVGSLRRIFAGAFGLAPLKAAGTSPAPQQQAARAF